MRRLLFLVLALVFLFSTPIPIAKASDEESLLHYAVTNDTASDALTAVSTTTIIPGKHRILGFRVNPITSGSGTCVGGLYDAASTGDISSANLIGEDSGANTVSAGYDFKRPVSITNGIYVSQGANSTVIIYYERKTP